MNITVYRQNLAEYLIKNPDVNIEAAIKATNADPAKVYGYIASLASCPDRYLCNYLLDFVEVDAPFASAIKK